MALHRHHRVLGNRSDNRPVNIQIVDDVVHRWIHDHPAEAMELGWIVSKHDDPENVHVYLPKTLVSEPEKKPRQKKASTPEERRARKSYTIKTPGEEENVLKELEEALRDHLREEMGWSETVPAYFVWVAAAARALQ